LRKPTLDLLARSKEDPSAARLILYQASKMFGRIFLLKPTRREKIQRASNFSERTTQVIDFK
jgi:hypothetical protein